MYRKIVVLTVLALVILFSTAAAAADDKNPFHRNNSISLKGGYNYVLETDFSRTWQTENDSSELALSYERKLGRYFGLELTTGFSYSEETNSDVLTSADSFSSELESYYLSLSAIAHLPNIGRLGFYIGGGPDYYYTDAEFAYATSSFSIATDKTFNTFGAHGLAGAEVIIIKYPALKMQYDAPLGFFVEYRYAWINIEEADKDLVDDVNRRLGRSFNPHDLNIGGHGVFAGLRWHF